MSPHLPRNGQLNENTKALQWKFKASGRQLGNKCVCATVRWLNVVVRTHLPLGRAISMLSHKSIVMRLVGTGRRRREPANT